MRSFIGFMILVIAMAMAFAGCDEGMNMAEEVITPGVAEPVAEQPEVMQKSYVEVAIIKFRNGVIVDLTEDEHEDPVRAALKSEIFEKLHDHFKLWNEAYCKITQSPNLFWEPQLIPPAESPESVLEFESPLKKFMTGEHGYEVLFYFETPDMARAFKIAAGFYPEIEEYNTNPYPDGPGHRDYDLSGINGEYAIRLAPRCYPLWTWGKGE